MATSYQDVYDAFLSKILDDEWVNWTEEEITQDLRKLLEGAIPSPASLSNATILVL